MFKNGLFSAKRRFSNVNPTCGEVYMIYTMYRHNPLGFLAASIVWTFFLFIVVFVILAVCFYSYADQNDYGNLAQLFLGIALVVAAVLSIGIHARVRIIVCEKGLEFHGLKKGMFHALSKSILSPWDNLKRIVVFADDDGEGVVYRRLLYLKHPHGAAVDIGKIINVRYERYSTGRWLDRRDYYVIDPASLSRSDFGHYLMQYAPQVIEAARNDLLEVETLLARGPNK